MKYNLSFLIAGLLVLAGGGAFAYTAAGSIDWVDHCGFYKRDAAQDMCGIADGSFYLTGWYEGMYDLDGDYDMEPHDFGLRDIFVSKYNSQGELLWVRSAGSGRCDISGAVAALPDGTCVIAGAYGYGTASCTFGYGQPNSTVLAGIGLYDVCVAKYDGDGILQWARRAGGPEPDFAVDVSLTPDGSVYVLGLYGPSITFAPGLPTELTLTGETEYENFFLARYAADGSFQWAKNTPAFRVAALTDGGCAATACPGIFRYSADGTELWSDISYSGCNSPLAAMPGNDFVVAYNDWLNGCNVSRFHAEDNGSVSELWTVWLSSEGVYYDSPISVGPDGITTYCPYGEICSVASDGSWSSIGQTGMYLAGLSIAADSGLCYVTGNFSEDITVGGITLNHLGSGDFFIARAAYLNRYRVSAHCEGPGWVQFNSSDGTYWQDETATLTAVPVFPGVYEFSEWGGDFAGVADPTISFPVVEDTVVTAVFDHVDGAAELPAAGVGGLAVLGVTLAGVFWRRRRTF